ncbi:alpha-endosulfine isoform X2 [Strigops habroptila]|nr:alpha-endosulfine isoform X2 [Strigops habroptila]
MLASHWLPRGLRVGLPTGLVPQPFLITLVLQALHQPHCPAPEDMQEKEAITPERAEEVKLKAKYPNLGQKPGGSDFLMKRLQKGQKYFDSGDYNMAKAKMKNKQLPSAGPDKNLVTGDHIPTPQDLPQRKSSLVTSKLAG